VRKLNLYAELGVLEYWIIDPVSESVEQFSPHQGRFEPFLKRSGNEIGSVVLSGLRFSLSDVFALQLGKKP
jgi:Uma2 family endonuclease